MMLYIVVQVLLSLGVFSEATSGHAMWTDATSIAAQELTKEQIIALRRSGLAAAASITGSIVVFKDGLPENGPRGLENLVSVSELVVIGTVGTGKSWLTAGGDNIVTNYEVRVDRVLKGAQIARAGVNVSVLGGRVEFQNGTSAEVRTGISLFAPGERYLFFLEPAERRFELSHAQQEASGAAVFTPAFLYQGVYRLEPNKPVVSFGQRGRNVPGINRDERVFVADVARLCAQQRQ